MKLLIIFPFLLAGCAMFGHQEPKVNTVYQEVKVPVSNVPMPPNTDCPQVAIDKLTKQAASNDGEVAKAYRISVEQLRDCSLLRQKVIDKYREIAQSDAENINGLDVTPRTLSLTGKKNVLVPDINKNMLELKKELIREIKIQNDFNNLGEEFKNLSNKEYSVE